MTSSGKPKGVFESALGSNDNTAKDERSSNAPAFNSKIERGGKFST